MSIKILMSSALAIAMATLVGCKQSPYEKAEAYIDELETEVMSVTTAAQYDAVYTKIIELPKSEVMNNLTELSDGQKKEIVHKTVELTLEALAVKAILYVMPKDVTPTADDISKLANECIEKKLNTMTTPYADVRKLVYEYYHYAE